MNFAGKSLEEIEAEIKNSDFLWIKGENMGSMEKYVGVEEQAGMKFVVFQGGGRMNIDLLSEYMEMYPSSPVLFDPPKGIVSSSVPSPVHQKKSSVNSVDYNSSPVVGVEESPIYKLLKKQKPNWVNVNISLKLNLPTKSLYSVLISSFDDAEKEIANYVTEGVEIEDIRQAIAESIKNSFYTEKKSPSNKNLKIQTEDEPTED